MLGGASADQTANKLGLPLDLIMESENFQESDGVPPDLLAAVNVFSDMLTQWRYGPNGVVGLDYGSLPVVLRLRRVPRKDREQIFDDLRIMEKEALDALKEQRGT